jgi:hypothetical protein
MNFCILAFQVVEFPRRSGLDSRQFELYYLSVLLMGFFFFFYICHILERNWEYSETVHVDFKKAYDAVRREVLYNILIEFGYL